MANRTWLFVAIIVLLLPFTAAIELACGAPRAAANPQLSFQTVRAIANFSAALLGEGPDRIGIWVPLSITVIISATSATVTVLLAFGVGRVCGEHYPRHTWRVAAFAVGLRILPVTSVMPTFGEFRSWLHIDRGIILLVLCNALLYLPLAVAMLSGGPWDDVRISEAILDLDAPLTTRERVANLFRFLASDILITLAAVFLLTWSDFIMPSFLLGDHRETIAQVLESQQKFLGMDWGRLGATVIVAATPPLLMIAFVAGFQVYRGRGRFGDEAI